MEARVRLMENLGLALALRALAMYARPPENRAILVEGRVGVVCTPTRNP